MNQDQITQTIVNHWKESGYSMREREKLVDPGFPHSFNPSAGHSTLLYKKNHDIESFKQLHEAVVTLCIRQNDSARAPLGKRTSLFKMGAAFSSKIDLPEAISQYLEMIKKMSLDAERTVWTIWGGGRLGTTIWNKELPPDDESEKTLRDLGVKNIHRTRSTANYFFPAAYAAFAGPRTEIFYLLPNNEYVEMGTIEKLEYFVQTNENKAQVLIPYKELVDIGYTIGTGTGLERLEMVVNGYNEIWDISTFSDYLKLFENWSSSKTVAIFKEDIIDIIDKFRALVFAIYDDADKLASNDTRKKFLKNCAKTMVGKAMTAGFNTEEFWILLYNRLIKMEGAGFPGLTIKAGRCLKFIREQTEIMMRQEPGGWFNQKAPLVHRWKAWRESIQ